MISFLLSGVLSKFQTIDPTTQLEKSDYAYGDAVLNEVAEAPLELIAT